MSDEVVEVVVVVVEVDGVGPTDERRGGLRGCQNGMVHQNVCATVTSIGHV
jgi:hypothetical protein